tara:strand:+ start:1746 stop:1994 length:249 start_codon:yes stop_codon:yes gene_type:complete
MFKSEAMTNANKISKLVEQISDIKAQLKECNSDLKELLEGTDLYNSIMKVTMEQSDKVPEKAAASQALKVTMAVYSAKSTDH